MSILAHNLYRLLANDLPGFEQSTVQSLYEKFISNGGDIVIEPDKFTVQLRKKRSLPSTMSIAEQYLPTAIPWLNDRAIHIVGATHS